MTVMAALDTNQVTSVYLELSLQVARFSDSSPQLPQGHWTTQYLHTLRVGTAQPQEVMGRGLTIPDKADPSEELRPLDREESGVSSRVKGAGLAASLGGCGFEKLTA